MGFAVFEHHIVPPRAKDGRLAQSQYRGELRMKKLKTTPVSFADDIERLSRRMHEVARHGDLLFAELFPGSAWSRDVLGLRPEGARQADPSRVASRAHKVRRSAVQHHKS